MISEWFTAQELSGMPGMPGTDRGVRAWVQKNLPKTRNKMLGKGIEIHLDSLPVETRTHIADRDLERISAPLSALVRSTLALPSASMPTNLPAVVDRRELTAAVEDPVARATTEQRQILSSRKIILGHVERIAREQGCSVRSACTLFLNRARNGQLSSAVMDVLSHTQAPQGKKSGDGIPSLPTLQRWIAVKRKDGADALLPMDSASQDFTPRPWHSVVMALYGRPQKPTVKSVFEQMCAEWKPEWGYPPGAPAPSYQQVLRFLQKVSASDKMKGRYQGSALREKKFYQHRDSGSLAPWDLVHADGWNTHFRAPHPITGEPVTYEVWHFHDVATRYVTPMSIGLTENTDVILCGLRECIKFGGVPAILQTDSTKSIKNHRVELDQVSGLAPRLGMEVKHPAEVGNSQANGIAENFNTWLDKESRTLATYMNPRGMDESAFKRIGRIYKNMTKARKSGDMEDSRKLKLQVQREGRGIVFESHQQAVDWIHSLEEKWNSKPHRSLPKVRGADGKMVHMSPAQALSAARAAGWEPVMLTEPELHDEFRLHVRKTVRRGAVSAYAGQRYRCSELDHLEGSDVLVAIDADEYRYVDIKKLDGSLIARAELVEAVGYVSQTLADISREKRAAAQIRRREKQIDQIVERMAPSALESSASEVLELPATLVIQPELQIVSRLAESVPQHQADEPNGMTDFDRYCLQLAHDRKAQKAAQEQAELAEISARLERMKREAGDGGDEYLRPAMGDFDFY
jgi:putative transposase